MTCHSYNTTTETDSRDVDFKSNVSQITKKGNLFLIAY